MLVMAAWRVVAFYSHRVSRPRDRLAGESGQQHLLWRQFSLNHSKQHDRGPDRPSGYQEGATADTVSELCQQGQLTEAVEALGVLVQTDCRVSQCLFYTVLKNCVGQRDLVGGRRVHALTVVRGHESDTFLCNHFLRMYASHGRLQEAMDVFELVAEADAFTWSAIISAHVKQGQDKQAIQLYNQMCRASVKPDGYVFVAALQACARGADLKTGQQVHAHVLASGFERDSFVCNSLVDMYAKCGSLEDAQRLFDGLGTKNVVTWNAMIAGYSQQGRGQESLHLYSEMQEEGIAAPDAVTFVSLLQACASLGMPGLEKGKQLHAQLRERGYQADPFVANSLVNMYAKCAKGTSLEALHLYSTMQQEGMAAPDSVTFVCLLQACANVGTLGLEKGKQLHAHIRELELQADVILGSSLVNMYAKCGSLDDARGVFDKLGQKDVVTWSAMIAGYSQQGMGQEALHLYSAMQEEDTVSPNSVTFLCLLQACASVGNPALQKGKQIHAQIKERGLHSDVSVANSLVNMYAKCGSLEDARDLFDRLSKKDVVTWSAMIAGYSKQGLGQEALHLYGVLQEEGIIAPTAVIFVCLLQACGSVGTLALERGKQLHAHIREVGVQADVFVANSLVNMYAKCGSLEDAQAVFDGLGQKDVVTWSAMIAGYSQQGMGQEALDLYSVMQEEGIVAPNSVTFVCLLQACASVGTLALEKGKQLHAQIRERRLQADVFVASSLVNMYTKCGSLEDARDVFDGLGQKNVVTWAALISGYSEQGMGQEALRLYSAMEGEGMADFSSATYVRLLQACASVGNPALEKGKLLHTRITERGLQADVFVSSSLVNMYAKCGSLEDARSVFDKLDQKNVVTWNAMIAGYSQQGMGDEALRLYRAMQEGGTVAPDSVTFVCLLQACANVAAFHLGRQLHEQIKEQGLQADGLVAISLINMYGKSGSMADAQQVFEALPERDVVAWSALIAGYAFQGETKVVFDLVQRMREDGVQPVGITFLSVLTVCSHAGLVNKGREYFDVMSKKYGITPTVEHYTCMVDLLGRAGRLDEALALVRTMAVVPNAAVWHTLLGSCRKWSNVELGRHAFDEAVKLDKKDVAAYVLMSNIYTSAQMWEQAEEMQARRKGIRAWKEPGQTWWTDMDGLVHSFFVGDKQHAESEGSLLITYAGLERASGKNNEKQI